MPQQAVPSSSRQRSGFVHGWTGAVLAALALPACGTDPSPPTDGGGGLDGGADASCTEPLRVAVVTTDFTTGGASLVDLDDLRPRTDLTTVHSDAVVRCACGSVLVLERLGADNLTVLQPGTLAHRAQVPLGRRTNPQDLWVEGGEAYVTLHETGEIVAVDLATGTLTERIDLAGLADLDGQAEPAAIHGFAGRLHVALQRLDRDTPLWEPAGRAALAVLGTAPLVLEGVVELEGVNPVTRLRPVGDGGVVLVGHAGSWSDSTDGGIERVDLAAGLSLGMLVGGEALGGSVIDLEVVAPDRAYAAVNVPGSRDDLVAFDPSSGAVLGVVASAPPYSMVRLLADGRGRLLVASRDPAAPGLRVFDGATGAERPGGPVPTGLPPFDLCLVPEPPDRPEPADGGQPPDDGGPDDEPYGLFIAELVAFHPGPGATFGADALPDVVLGPPHGGGERSGSLDVLSLGCGGVVELGFDPPIVDGPGPDFIVFENPFLYGGRLFVEPGQVLVSADGTSFVELPCEPEAGFAGCAGLAPVFARPGNGIDPTDPAVAGGDAFDLAEAGLAEASHVRIVDRSAEDPVAAAFCGTAQAGFDLDAVAVVRRDR